MAIDEEREMRHFTQYREQNKELGALAIEATWLANKGACSVEETPHGTRIRAVYPDKYKLYCNILNEWHRRNKLPDAVLKERWTELVRYGKMKLGKPF